MKGHAGCDCCPPEGAKASFVDSDDMMDVDEMAVLTDSDIEVKTEDNDAEPIVHLHHSVHNAGVTHCHVECPAAFCLHKKLKRTNWAREKDRRNFEANLKKRRKQIQRLKEEVNQAQDLVQEYSGLTEQLGSELEGLKAEAKHKLKIGSKKYAKVAARCTELAEQLKETGKALSQARKQHKEGSTKLEAEVHKLRHELNHTQRVAEKNRELVQLREAELEKEKMREHALQTKSVSLQEALKQTKKEHKKSVVENQMLKEELKALKIQHERCKQIAEKLQGKVAHLKADLVADTMLKYRQQVVAEANNHYREMKPYLGIVFTTEPWPVSSTHGSGTLLKEVKHGGAGYSSGLRKGDVVTEVKGKPTRNKTEFYASLYGTKPGDPIHCHIIRPSQGPGIVRAIDVTMGATGYSLKQVLAIRRLAERDPKVHDVDFDVDVAISGLQVDEPDP